MTHCQWTFRNGTLHLKGPDGLTATQQGFLSRRCEALLSTDPSTLLSEDRYLLEIDFDSLADGPASEQQTWLSEMDAARCVARFADVGYTDAILDNPDTHISAPVDTEGSVVEHSDCSISQILEEVEPLSCNPLMAQVVALGVWKRKEFVRCY
jgi:hypothetical protein